MTQEEAITKYLENRVAMTSGSQQQDNQQKILLIGGVGILMVYALIMTK